MCCFAVTPEECEDVKKAVPLSIKISPAKVPLLRTESQNSTPTPQSAQSSRFEYGDSSDKLDKILSYLKIIESQNSRILTEVKEMKQRIEMLERKGNEE